MIRIIYFCLKLSLKRLFLAWLWFLSAPSYVNVKVMDVWRGRRVNRWLVDGQHFITGSRGRRGAEMLPSVTSEGENTQITPALSLQMDNIYFPTQLLLSSQQTSLHHIQAGSPCSDENRRTMSGEPRSEDLRRSSEQHYLPGVTNVNIAPHKG